MPSILSLVRGTRAVLPIALERYKDGLNSIKSYKVVDFKGTKLRIYYFTITASGVYSPPNVVGYSTQIGFKKVKDFDKPQSNSKDEVIGRCSCLAYYFWASWANIKRKCHFGAKFTLYKRKTPENDPRYPPKNPDAVPCFCKHQLLAVSTLVKQGKVE
jgi:hypothetical protein